MISHKTEEIIMQHPNLSDDINANLLRLELNGGVHFDKLPAGAIVEVQTRNTLYTVRKEIDRTLIRGGRCAPQWAECRINGSTWGGSMIVGGFIGNGMYLEVSLPDRKTITTTAIRSVKVLS
jgi:hypothetical protein